MPLPPPPQAMRHAQVAEHQVAAPGTVQPEPGLMYPIRKTRDGGGSGTPGDSPGTHREFLPGAVSLVSESPGEVDLGHVVG